MEDTRPVLRVLEQKLKEKAPDLLRHFYPKIYEGIGGYNSPKDASVMMASSVMDVLFNGLDKAPSAYRVLYPSLDYLISKRMPTMFISPNLLEAVKRTNFDEVIHWQDMELPYESGVLVLPKGSLTHPKSGEVAVIVYSRIKKGIHRPPIFIGGKNQFPEADCIHDFFSIVGIITEDPDPSWFAAVLTPEKAPVVKIGQLFYENTSPHLDINSVYDEVMTEEDDKFVEKIGALVFGVLLALTIRPDLLTKEELLKSIPGKKGGFFREFWSPNVIGKHYITKTIFGEGTHASPRLHWRRGHFRQQVCGSHLALRKTIWIEPVWVGV